jgi:hypothetical protein
VRLLLAPPPPCPPRHVRHAPLGLVLNAPRHILRRERAAVLLVAAFPSARVFVMRVRERESEVVIVKVNKHASHLALSSSSRGLPSLHRAVDSPVVHVSVMRVRERESEVVIVKVNKHASHLALSSSSRGLPSLHRAVDSPVVHVSAMRVRERVRDRVRL